MTEAEHRLTVDGPVIDEFRAKEGRVGGRQEGLPLLLLHSTGARSGVERVKPMTYLEVGDDFAVFGSYLGRPGHPDWYHNLVANPRASIEVGTEHFDVVARVAQGSERDEIWERQKEHNPKFVEIEAKAPRQIPVVVLERIRG